jgi:hypothetical protein
MAMPNLTFEEVEALPEMLTRIDPRGRDIVIMGDQMKCYFEIVLARAYKLCACTSPISIHVRVGACSIRTR